MTTRTRFALVSFLLAVLGGLMAAFGPLGRTCVIQAVPGTPPSQERCSSGSTFETDGAWVLVVVSVPIVIALIPVLVRHRTVAVASMVLLWVCCVVGALSVGMFFVPSAVLMTIAAARCDPVQAAPI